MRNFPCFEVIFELNGIFHRTKKSPTLKRQRFFRRKRSLSITNSSFSRKKHRFPTNKTPCFHLRQPYYHFESDISHENHPKTRKNFTDSFVSHFHHITRKCNDTHLNLVNPITTQHFGKEKQFEACLCFRQRI